MEARMKDLLCLARCPGEGQILWTRKSLVLRRKSHNQTMQARKSQSLSNTTGERNESGLLFFFLTNTDFNAAKEKTTIWQNA